jgi:hypothetical protein
MSIQYIQGLCQSRLSTADYALSSLASTYENGLTGKRFSLRDSWDSYDATIELLEAVFSMRFVPRCYKQDKSRI